MLCPNAWKVGSYLRIQCEISVNEPTRRINIQIPDNVIKTLKGGGEKGRKGRILAEYEIKDEDLFIEISYLIVFPKCH